MQSNIFLYQICYQDDHLDSLDPDFMALENRDNLRPDWREYWPIRNHLLKTDLDEDGYYGFLSPKFSLKTGLAGADVKRFVNSHPEADVLTFSPQADMGAFFLNVFEQGETFDPGFLETAQELLSQLDYATELKTLVMDSRQVVFSNFIVARPAFWRQWLMLCEQIFALAESGDSALADKINAPTTYPGEVPRKVFIIERMASFLLTSGQWRCAPYSTYQCAWSALPTSQFKQEAISSDALKMAHNETGDEVFLSSFATLRKKLFSVTKTATLSSKTTASKAIKQTPAHTIVNTDLLNLMPSGVRRIVEVGCMHGAMANACRDLHPSVHYFGIDIDPEYAQVAAQFCDQTLGIDIESMSENDFQTLFPSDCWIFGDCLEHLRDPWRIMRMVRKSIDPDGCTLICIPNAQHWSVQMRLATGQFHYEDSGLLDRTHLRWFTRTTLLEMFSETGWRIEHGFSRQLPTQPPPGLLEGIQATATAAGADGERTIADTLAFQYLFRLRPDYG